MTTQLQKLEELRQSVPPERLQPGYKLDAATREKYRNQPVMRGVAGTKSELLNLGDAITDASEPQTRSSS